MASQAAATAQRAVPVTPDSEVGAGNGGDGSGPRGPHSPRGAGRPPVTQTQKRVRIGAVVVLWFLAALFCAFLYGSNNVPDGVVVNGVDIGGMDRQSAINKLDAAFGKVGTAAITINALDNATTVQPSRLGLEYDAAATVDGVQTNRWNPIDLIDTWFGGGSTQLVIPINHDAMRLTIAALASRNDRPVQEPQVTYEGKNPIVIDPVVGRMINQKTAETAIAAAFLSGKSVDLPIVTDEPKVGHDQTVAFAVGPATHAVAEPIKLVAGSKTISVSSDEIAASLAYRVDNGQFVPQVDGAKLHGLLAAKLGAADKPAKDATWDVSSGSPVLVPATDGAGVTDDQNIADAVASALNKSGADRQATLGLGPLHAKLTTEAAQRLGIRQKLASFTQHFPYAKYRINNIGLAAKKINGTTLAPGQVFSFNDTVGERTAANGFMKGFVVGEGGVLQEDWGGGVSTMATALWHSVFFSGLQAVEHGNHLIWISRYTAGLEATVAWGQLDLKFRNDTPTGIYLTAKLINGGVRVGIWGTKQYDQVTAEFAKQSNKRTFAKITDSSPTCLYQAGVDGFDVNVARIFTKDGREAKRENYLTSYIPAPEVICKPGRSST